MGYTFFLKKIVLSLLLVFCGLFVYGQSESKLNILFIAVDDLKPNIGCFGDPLAQTPSLDALAEKGLVFSHAYCQQAVCAPSRASLLTSQYPDQTKVWDLQTLIRDVNDDIVTLPQYFKQNGYRTAGVGKIFDYRSVTDNDVVSWSEPYGNPYAQNLYNEETGKPVYWYADPHAKDTLNQLIAEAQNLGVNEREYALDRYKPSTECADVPYDAYIDGAIAKVGMQLLEEAVGDEKPFFVAVGFQRPHLPFNAPKEFWDLYDPKEFNLAEFRERAQNSPSIAYHNWDELRDYTDIPGTGGLSDEKQLQLIHAYYAATSYIDFLIGMLTDKLNELGLAENTAIVVWGDHGWHLGDHNLWCKHSNFEEATRAPLIISYPGQPNQGHTYSSPVEFTDIAPTLCELGDIKIPAFFEGESLIPVFQSPEVTIREGSLSQYPRNSYMGYSLRTERYRYTKWVDKESKAPYTSELYDYELDPLETKNVVSDSLYRAVKDSLDKIVTERIKIPSTQNKIRFKIFGTGKSGELEELKNCPVWFDGYEMATDSKGEVAFTHIDGSYSFEVKTKGYKAYSGALEVDKDTSVQIELEAQLYDVKFYVKGKWNDNPLSQSDIWFNNQTHKTDSLGMVSFFNVAYDTYDVEVTMENGFEQVFSNVEIYSDTTIVLSVDRPSFLAKVQVVDAYSGLNVYNTLITLNDVSGITDSKGYVIFSEIEGNYKLTIENEVYRNISDSVYIRSDTTFFYSLIPTFARVKFKLKENTTPVNNALICFANDSNLTSSLGIASFDEVPADSVYDYSIRKDGYKTIQDSFFLRVDTTINIQMERTATFLHELSERKFRIWPNPAETILNIQTPPGMGPVTISLYNLPGQKILDKSFTERIGKLNLNGIKNGMYMVRLKSGYNLIFNHPLIINRPGR